MRFSDRLEQHYEALLARRSDQRSTFIPMLRAVQKEQGYVSDQALGELSRRAGLSEADAANVATYLDVNREAPPSRHLLQVCINSYCRRRGGEALLEHCKRSLGVDLDQVTPDRLFRVQGIVCLRACDGSPAIRINHEVHEAVTPAQVDAILERIRKASEG